MICPQEGMNAPRVSSFHLFTTSSFGALRVSPPSHAHINNKEGLNILENRLGDEVG